MSKNKKNKSNVEAPVVEVISQDEAVNTEITEPVAEQPVTEATVEAAAEPIADKRRVAKLDTRTFCLVNAEFKPKKKLDSQIFALLAEGFIGNPQAIADELIARGAYQKVAPKAAALRPYKPVSFTLRTWLNAKYVEVVDASIATPVADRVTAAEADVAAALETEAVA